MAEYDILQQGPVPANLQRAPAAPPPQNTGGLTYEDLEGLHRVDAQLADMGYPATGELPPLPQQVQPADQLNQEVIALEQEAADARAMAGQMRTVTGPNPLYPARKEYTDTMRPLLEQQPELQQGVYDARRMEAQAGADAFQAKADAYRDMYIDNAAAEQVRQEELQAARQRQQQSVRAHDVAIRNVKEAQEMDPDRFWQEKSTGQKIAIAAAALLTGIGGGWNGDAGAGARFVNDLVGREVAKQKENYARLQNVADLRERQVGEQQSLYAQLMAQMQDERQVDLALENAQIEAVLAEGEAYIQQAGVHTLSAEQAASMNELRQRLADNRMQIEMMAATNRPTISRTVHALPRAARDVLERGAERMEKRSDRLQGAEMDMRKDAAKGPSESDARQRQKDAFEQKRYIEKETRPYRNELNLIQRYQQEYKDEIPGLVWGLGWKQHLKTDAEVQAYDRLKRIVMVRLRRESGAAIPPDELEQEAAALVNAMDEDDVRNLLKDRAEEAQFQIDHIERAPAEDAVSEFTRSAPVERAPMRMTGDAAGSRVRVDR